MNTLADLVDGRDVLPDLDSLLAPLSGVSPCGPSIRHDPVFTEIRLLREEDDPGLPMGQWERPLKRADWPRIEALCTMILVSRAKDLQMAAWLAESWIRQRGVVGLADGLRLIDGLLLHYWDSLHPQIEMDGDSEARLAPLEWLNAALATCVRLHAPLAVCGGERPVAVTLALWERLTVEEVADGNAGAGAAADEAPLTRAAVVANLGGADLPATALALQEALASLRSMNGHLHGWLADDAPNLGRLETTLLGALRALGQLQPGGLSPPWETVAVSEDEPERAPEPAAPGLANLPDRTIASPRWQNRAEAYRTLSAIADYLGEVEPHSPTPFLIRRAAAWGSMSLPEVIAEIIREEGDVGRLLKILGVRS